MDLQEAIDRILDLVQPATEEETVTLTQTNGRIAAAPISAPLNLPPFRSSAMDGYAFAADGVVDGATLQVVGESLAGHPFAGSLGPGECIRITTGAAVPESADTVLIQENAQRVGDAVTVVHMPGPDRNIRDVGHDVRAGTTIISSGKRLNAFDVGWLAACGIGQARVWALPRVAVFSTGDELIEPGEQLGAGQIFDSNRFALTSLLARAPAVVTDLGALPDDRAALRSALGSAAARHDLLLTSGGVSVGDADYVRDVVGAMGRIDLWRLNIKPGKPLAFGHIDDTPFLGLPGNPVSTIVTYLLIAQPLLTRLAGGLPQPPTAQRATLDEPLHHTPGREEYQRGIIERRGDVLWVRSSGDQSSNRLATFSDADCLIRVPRTAADLPSGTCVDVLPFTGLLG